eukprot:CAMPEP_0202977910 /NCGR_PEP_ID=MMETSP1396-20130829/84527_1 /ASSEMBLY_ACC=CAM_ASM_000872 /TAXON_ID= /ORGANISM="Pseudokeronopsis sp., Strain Brazil" /LENGTH=128 /DNA_ID=CAMNT_0049716739 /DNA_START=602 /DNA_END=988 /DNA_ORIENTATION=+
MTTSKDFCIRPSYAIESFSDGLCLDIEDNYFGVCYPKCKNDFIGVGPICWEQCPHFDGFDCGAICTNDEELCNLLIRDDGKSINIIDVIYLAEMKEHGHCDIEETIRALRNIAPDFNFKFCDEKQFFE